jgi:hypothetical protein
MVSLPMLPMKVIIILPIAVIITISLLMQSLQFSWSQPSTTNTTTNANIDTNPNVYPPDSKPYNLTYGEWSAKWWQWVLLLPQDINPLLDNTGEDCARNQSGAVWFLAGTTGGSVVRTCTIPEGNAILFPVLNFVNIRTLPTETEQDLRVIPKDQADKATILEASVDGVSLQDLQNYRAQSPALFNVTFPENNLFGIPPGSSEAVADGYWVMLQPLPAGQHTIQFRGAYVDVTGAGGAGNIVTEATYHLTITPAVTSNATASAGAANNITNSTT